VQKNPKVSASTIATELGARRGEPISSQTVRRILKNTGYNSRTAVHKPFISEVNRKKRLAFASQYIDRPENYWNDVIFTDESKFNIFGSDGRQKVWRLPNTELEKKNLKVTVKHGGGSVMVWGCFAASGIGSLVFIDGIMNSDVYIDILREHLHSSAEKLGIRKTFKFYQDNDPKHKSFKTREWLLYNCPRVLETPPQSPDCNPIEHVWDHLDREIRKTPITGRNHLKERLQEEWAKIPTSYLQNLVSSMPRRLEQVIQAKGLHTKY
jgi:transposase